MVTAIKIAGNIASFIVLVVVVVIAAYLAFVMATADRSLWLDYGILGTILVVYFLWVSAAVDVDGTTYDGKLRDDTRDGLLGVTAVMLYFLMPNLIHLITRYV